jgi:3-oxoacyl-(acyl-carrier-protein) synthase
MPEARGVVITGLGLVLPPGVGLGAAEDVFAGRSAVSRLAGIPGIPDATGAAVSPFNPPPGTESADRAVQFAVAAAEEAWAGADLARSSPPPERMAAAVSLSKGGIHILSRAAEGHTSAGDVWSSAMPDAAGAAIAARMGIAGPVVAPITACASGGHALIWGASLIRRGVAEVALVGAAEASFHPLVIGSYHRMGVLAPAGDDPATSVRPFSATRRGFALGEGAGCLVLESEVSAARRGVQPLARVAGWAAGCQAFSLTDMEPSGATLARLMTDALARAGVRPEAVDYIHAHGTATLSNDLAEARAIRAALGCAAGHTARMGGVSVSSTKGAHGHLLGAATAVELVLTVLAMVRGVVPPTANLTDPDPGVGLDCTPLAARRRPVKNALKIASGFGGQTLAIVLARP